MKQEEYASRLDAKLVVKGLNHIWGTDFDEIISPIVHVLENKYSKEKAKRRPH